MSDSYNLPPFARLVTEKTITVIVDGKTYQTDRGTPNEKKIIAALNDPKTTPETMIGLMKPITAVTAAVRGVKNVTVRGNSVFWGDEEIDNFLTRRLLDVMSAGFAIDPWLRFLENVMANPYDWSREEFGQWDEKSGMPITGDGCIYAYKAVNDDYTDCRTGTISNRPGEIVVMPGGREAVDPDRARTCSYGLHFCSKDYLPFAYTNLGAKRVMLIKINPADVVSIPKDHGFAKGRCWRYEVVREIDQSEIESLKWNSVEFEDDDPDFDDDIWDDYDEDGDPVEDWEPVGDPWWQRLY